MKISTSGMVPWNSNGTIVFAMLPRPTHIRRLAIKAIEYSSKSHFSWGKGLSCRYRYRRTTCWRASPRRNTQTMHGMEASEGATARIWKQPFNTGCVQQAFTRACVRESLQHGEANAPFCQRADCKRVTTGKVANYRKFTEEEVAPLPPSVLEAANAEGVHAAAEFAPA